MNTELDEDEYENEDLDDLEPQEVFRKFIESNELWHTEGTRGVKSLCKIVNSLGYKDFQHFGQYENGSSIGDLVTFLEDNPGAIEAIKNWVKDNIDGLDDWIKNLKDNI